jgi:hypothetical protein
MADMHARVNKGPIGTEVPAAHGGSAPFAVWPRIRLM